MTLLTGLNGWAQGAPWAATLAVVFAQGGPLIIAGLGVVLWFVLPRGEERIRRALIYAFAAGVIALAVSGLIGEFVFRIRPEYADPTLIHPLIAHKDDSSFPSDHAALAMASAVAMFFAGGLGWVFLALAVLTAIARVAVGVHWPSDVLAGALLGFLSAYAVLRGRGRIEGPVRWILKRFGYGEAPGERRGGL